MGERSNLRQLRLELCILLRQHLVLYGKTMSARPMANPSRVQGGWGVQGMSSPQPSK